MDQTKQTDQTVVCVKCKGQGGFAAFSTLTGPHVHDCPRCSGAGRVPLQSLTVHDLIEYWDSYIVDMENNLAMDTESWDRYEQNPKPFYKDLLFDHGTFPKGASFEAIAKMVDAAIANYCSGRTA